MNGEAEIWRDTKGTVFNYIRKFQIKKYMYRRNDLSINVL